MSALEIFDYSGQTVRTVAIDGEPWFVLTDIAAILGYRDANNARRLLRPHQWGYSEVSTPSGMQQMLICSEKGLYRLILRSGAAKADEVQDWVTDEVLPAIRKTGGYSTGPKALEFDINNRDHLSLIITAGHAALTRAMEAEAKVAELEPAAEAWDSLASADADFSVREAAQVLSRDDAVEIGQNRLFAYLREIGWIDKTNAPYQAQVDAGRLVRRITDYTDDFGQRFVRVQPRITPKGVKDLLKRLNPPPSSGLQLVSA